MFFLSKNPSLLLVLPLFLLIRGDSAYGGLDFPSSISPSFPLLCGLSSGQNWGAVELLVPHSISCLKPLELLMCAERACDLSSGGSDRGLLVRSTSSSERWCWSLRIGWLGAAVGCDLGAATIGFDCSEGNGLSAIWWSCAGCGGGGLYRCLARPIWAVRGLEVLRCCGLVCCGLLVCGNSYLVCVWVELI
ncbi:hypothetical protein ACOSQ2_003662 [Xanthoceras sorbifolium]